MGESKVKVVDGRVYAGKVPVGRVGGSAQIEVCGQVKQRGRWGRKTAVINLGELIRATTTKTASS